MIRKHHLLRSKISKISFAIVLLPVALWLPSPGIYADSCTPPAETTGVSRPVGADASLFVYKCSTGLWVSPHFSFDPNTGVYTPLDTTVYTYDPSANDYNYVTWVYDPTTGSYEQQTDTTQNPPSGADVVGAPTQSGGSAQAADTTPTNTTTNQSTASSPSPTSTTTTSTTTPNNAPTTGSSGTAPSSSSGATADINTGASVTNNDTSQSTSGDATVTSNVKAGNATSGDSSGSTTSVNTVQSTTNTLGANTVTFTANINGNVNGNFLVDPGSLPSTSTSSPQPTVDLNNTTNASITNNINVGAQSGSAQVTNNVLAGSATTGNASAIAQVVNIIDSAVSSGKSFIGVININGNLNGNILIPASLFDQLMADNTPTVNVTTTLPVSVIDSLVNEGIANNVSENASSGNASVTNNVSGGNATTGTATATITAFNLTGSNIIGNNDLFVFVNVVGGKWIGLILNAPPGTTAAEIGGSSVASSMPSNVNNTTNASITNNISLSASSGNATVDHNVLAGNATSGNATDSVDLLNIADSNLIFTNWFGLLFINVFGVWNGNFGLYYPPAPPTQSSSLGPDPVSQTVLPRSPLVSFQPKSFSSAPSDPTVSYVVVPVVYEQYIPPQSQTLTGYYTTTATYYTTQTIPGKTVIKNTSTNQGKSSINWLLIAVAIAAYAVFLAGDRIYVHRKRHNR